MLLLEGCRRDLENLNENAFPCRPLALIKTMTALHIRTYPHPALILPHEREHTALPVRCWSMKTKIPQISLACLLMATAASCTTAYDAYGRPRTVVEPGAAALGVAAAGLAGYALANNNDRHHYRRSSYRGYDRGYGRRYYY
jgi:hypothetical protein